MTDDRPSQPIDVPSDQSADEPGVELRSDEAETSEADAEEPAEERADGPRVELPPDEALAGVASYEAEVTRPDTFQPALAVGWAFGLGGLGAVIWAFITYVTDYELGLIAILLGIMAGLGAARGGRTEQSQIVGAVAAAVCYFVAQLMVVFAIVTQRPDMPPVDVEMLGFVVVEIIKSTFSSMGVLFLGIAVYEGYRIPRPV